MLDKHVSPQPRHSMTTIDTSALDKLKALDPPDAWPFQYAEIYAQRGDKQSALRALTKAETSLDRTLLALRTDWLLDPIRGTPEFKAIEARINFPP